MKIDMGASNDTLRTSSFDAAVHMKVSEEVDGKKQQKCEPCKRLKESKQTKMYCKNCEEFQCSNCLENHKRFPMMSKHVTVAMDEVQSTERCPSLMGFDRCEEHQSPIEIYCERHDDLCCIKCAFKKHRQCSDAKDVSEFMKQFEQSGENTLYKKQLDKCVKETDNIALLSEESTEKVKKEILVVTNKLKDKILDMFEDQQSQLLKELQAKSEEYNMSKIRHILTEVKTWQATLIALMAHGTDEQCFILSKKTMAKLSEYENFIQQMKTEGESSKMVCGVNINKGMVDLVQKKTQLFTLKLKEIDRKAE